MEFGVFEIFGLSGAAIAEGATALGIRMAFPQLSLGLFDDKALVLSLDRPDAYAPDLSYVRYAWRVPVTPAAIRRFAQTPISGNNSPTAFVYAAGEAALVTLEWQVADGVLRGRYRSDRPVPAALIANGCFAAAEVVQAHAGGAELRQGEHVLSLRLAGAAAAPFLAGDRKQAENALLVPGFVPSGKALAAYPLTLTPEQPLYFALTLDREAPTPQPASLDETLAAGATRYEQGRMRSTGSAAGAAEALAALSGYGRAYDPRRQRLQTTVNRTWGGPNGPGLVCGWDNFFTSYLAAWENPQLAAASLEHIVQCYGERGPEHGPTQRNLIIPIVYCRTVELTGDLDLARRTWPAMLAFMRFWFADRGDGIAWRDGNGDGLIDSGSSLSPSAVEAGLIVSNAMDETGYDEIPTYSGGFTDRRRGLLAEGVQFDWRSQCLTVALVCQNSLYVAACRKMALLAARLGDEAARAWLAAEADRVARRIGERLFDPACGWYHDRHWNGEFSPAKTLTIFFPLLAGLPDAAVRARLRQALLDPRQFWGDNLVPTVARDANGYRDGLDGNGNYWRGNCWAPTTYMVWLAAREAGWYDVSALLAEKVAAQFLESWQSLGHAYENYPAEGPVDPRYVYAGGAWGGREIRYVWSALMPLCLLEELFAIEPVGDGFQFGNPFLAKPAEWHGLLCQGRRVHAAASADCTCVDFGGEWRFEARPGLAIRNFRLGGGEVSFRVEPAPRGAEIRITAKDFAGGELPRVQVAGRQVTAVRWAEDGRTLAISLPGAGGKWFQMAVLGDSIVHGGCDAEAGGWVARLRLHCWRHGLGDHVFELGLGGNTSRHLLERAETDIRARLGHTDYVLFGTGTNDMNSAIPPEEFRANLERLGTIATRLGKRAGFVGLTLNTAHPPATWALYDGIVREVCERGGYLHFPLAGVLAPADLVDACHPNARGHEKICARMVAMLQERGLL